MSYAVCHTRFLTYEAQNSGTYDILLSEDGGAKFYRMNKPHGKKLACTAQLLAPVTNQAGVGGGSESWEYKLGQLCFGEYLHHSSGSELLPRSKRDILEDFNVKKRKLGPDAPWHDRDFIHELQEPQWKVRIHASQVKQLCKDALRQPLLLAEQQIKIFSQLGGRGVPLMIVVSGGSAKHPYVQEQLKAYCEKYRLPVPRFSHDFIGFFE